MVGGSLPLVAGRGHRVRPPSRSGGRVRRTRARARRARRRGRPAGTGQTRDRRVRRRGAARSRLDDHAAPGGGPDGAPRRRLRRDRLSARAHHPKRAPRRRAPRARDIARHPRARRIAGAASRRGAVDPCRGPGPGRDRPLAARAPDARRASHLPARREDRRQPRLRRSAGHRRAVARTMGRSRARRATLSGPSEATPALDPRARRRRRSSVSRRARPHMSARTSPSFAPARTMPADHPGRSSAPRPRRRATASSGPTLPAD